MVTQAELKEKYRYCKDSGLFFHISGIRAGGICGVLRPDGYIKIDVNKKSLLAHRMAFLYVTGEPPANVVDHINGIKSDNRWINLRAVTQQENSMNQHKLRKNKTSKYKGVTWDKARNLWASYITYNGKINHLGRFAEESDAAQAYNFAAEKTFGEYARLNSGTN